MAYLCVYRSLHHLLKMSIDTAFDLGVTNHVVERGAVFFVSCRAFSTLGLNNSAATSHAKRLPGMS